MYVFAIIARAGEIKLNIFVLEDLILYIMVNTIGFDKHGAMSQNQETDVLFQKNYRLSVTIKDIIVSGKVIFILPRRYLDTLRGTTFCSDFGIS